jgi:hypothetical protein
MSNGQIPDALKLEHIEYIKSANTVANETRTEIQAMEAEMRSKGLYSSGPRYTRDLEIRFGKIEGHIMGAIAKRKQLGSRFPELLKHEYLSALKAKLGNTLQTVVQSQYDRIARDSTGLPSASLEALNRLAVQKADFLRGRLNQELEILQLEADLGLNEGEQPMTFNISNSTIASLNLGTVFGDLTASVNVLKGQGYEEFAASLEKLAEAVVSMADLQDSVRKELVEDVSFIAEQLARPREERKTGPLKSAIATLGESVKTVTQLVALWTPIEHFLKAHGYIS